MTIKKCFNLKEVILQKTIISITNNKCPIINNGNSKNKPGRIKTKIVHKPYFTFATIESKISKGFFIFFDNKNKFNPNSIEYKGQSITKNHNNGFIFSICEK